jgi:hypothetical protein
MKAERIQIPAAGARLAGALVRVPGARSLASASSGFREVIHSDFPFFLKRAY